MWEQYQETLSDGGRGEDLDITDDEAMGENEEEIGSNQGSDNGSDD